MDIIDARSLALLAIDNIRSELSNQIPVALDDVDRIIDLLDSMDMVNLIMETESLIESRFNMCIPLANEFTFDSERSPFNSLYEWVKHIKISVENANSK
jgi:hypothetical protein